MKKKILALALACALMLGLFCGCKDSAAPETETDQGSLPAESETQQSPGASVPAETPPAPPAEGALPEDSGPMGGFGPNGGQGFDPNAGQGFGPMEDPFGEMQLAQITDIDGDQVTVVLGTLDREDMKGDREGGFHGGMGPMGEAEGGFGQQGGLIMELPDSETGSAAAPAEGTGPTGTPPQDQMGTPPEGMGQGSFPEGQGQMGTPPEGMGQGGFPGGMDRGESHGKLDERLKQFFTPGEERMTLTVDEALLAELAAGDLVRLVTDENGTVTGLEPLNRFSDQGRRP